MSYSGTGNMFAPRAVFENASARFDPACRMTRLGRRAVALGYRWAYAPKARVAHPARRDWEALTRKLATPDRGELRLAAKSVPFGRLR